MISFEIKLDNLFESRSWDGVIRLRLCASANQQSDNQKNENQFSVHKISERIHPLSTAEHATICCRQKSVRTSSKRSRQMPPSHQVFPRLFAQRKARSLALTP